MRRLRLMRLTPGLIAGLIGAGCAAAPPPLPVPERPAPAAPVLAAAEITAIAELLRMEDRRQLDADRHAELLEHPQALVRSRAVLAAGRIGGGGATDAIIRLLDDPEPEVRADAAFALGLLRDSSRSAVGALSRRARGVPFDAAAAEAIAALGRIGGDAADEALRPLLRLAAHAADDGASRSDTLRAAEAALAAWRLPRSDALTAALTALASAPTAELRWRATYSLMRHAHPPAGGALLARLDDEDPLVRSLAARALRAPFADSAGLTGAQAALVRRLADADAHVRINAARALGTYRAGEIVDPLAAMLADSDSSVVFAATEALAAVGSLAVPQLARVAYDPGARPALQAVALGGLARAEWTRAAPLLEEWQQSREWLRRLYAARAIATASWDEAGGLAARLARDPDPRVAAAGFTALGAMLPDGGGRALITEGVAAGDPFVRAAALRALQRQVQPADLPLLLEAFAAALGDSEPEAGVAALDALAELAGRGVPVHRSFYARFTAPADPVLRRHAVERITPTPWRGAPIETGRSMAFYETVVRNYIAEPLAGAPQARARVTVPGGTIVLELNGAHAPLTVHNFASLVEIGFFDGRADASPRWHRVVPNFVLQDGDPRGDGAGGPGYAIRDELNRLRYGRGVLGMALAGPDTGGSQWFITHSPQPHLDAAYTIFGRVAAGMQVADAVLQDDPILSIEIERGPPLRGNGSP